MANKALFSSQKSLLPRTNTVNEAGGSAYQLEPKHALAQLAATGCFQGTFYASADQQLSELLKLTAQVDDSLFIAKLAIYARERAGMKDMPAALLLVLAERDPALMHRVFDRVVENGRMLRTVFQMVRSGQFRCKGLSSSLQRAFQRWLNEASVGKLLSASIGHHPSLRDILRLARPKPVDNERRALFGWLTDKEVAHWAPATEADLPAQVKRLIAYRQTAQAIQQAAIAEELSVRWDLLADAAKAPVVWKAIARQMGPQALRMNLNTLLRHEVLNDSEMVDEVARRLSDRAEIERSGQFPYQYLAAYLNVSEGVPASIKAALHQAAEIACGNVPELAGPIVIGLDTSGSMQSPVTGYRAQGATSKIRCVDVAALFTAAIARRNPDSLVIPFDTRAYYGHFDPSDSILSLSRQLARFGGGGTDCSIPLREANTKHRNRPFAGCVLISDNESWITNQRISYGQGMNATGVMTEWQKFVKNQVRLQKDLCTGPKLVCIDIQPYGSTQAPDRSDILNVGGFNDSVFRVIAAFLNDDTSRFVSEVESIEL